MKEKQVLFKRNTSNPILIGIQSRNSNNGRAQKVLDWKPKISLEEEMQKTVNWISEQVAKKSRQEGLAALTDFAQSRVINLQLNSITFEVLLPITSRGLKQRSDCLTLLARFAVSLAKTTWQDIHSLKDLVQYRLKVYLAFDNDDDFLLDDSKPAENVFVTHGITDISSLICNCPRGHVCTLWRICAQQAWEDGCDYMALFGDDVELLDEGWLGKTHNTFRNISKRSKALHGLACVAFTNISFPGFPTFPV